MFSLSKRGVFAIDIRHKSRFLTVILAGLLLTAGTGCGQPAAAPTTGTRPGANTAAFLGQRLYHVMQTRYAPHTQTVTIYAKPVAKGGVSAKQMRSIGGESTIDLATPEGIVNYATAQYATHSVRKIELLNANRAHHTVIATLPVPKNHAGSDASLRNSLTLTGASVISANNGFPIPPPGVRIDWNFRPLASVNSSYAAKLAAVKQVAQSKLGTPYIWGHNEDRGQYGFDCSNFTEYVYHHSLGYLMTTSSKGQYLQVGVPVAKSQMRPGDLLIFEYGAHVGIYVGNGRMIEEGGGLGKVGYLSIKTRSYWGNHFTVAKRLF